MSDSVSRPNTTEAELNSSKSPQQDLLFMKTWIYGIYYVTAYQISVLRINQVKGTIKQSKIK